MSSPPAWYVGASTPSNTPNAAQAFAKKKPDDATQAQDDNVERVAQSLKKLASWWKYVVVYKV